MFIRDIISKVPTSAAASGVLQLRLRENGQSVLSVPMTPDRAVVLHSQLTRILETPIRAGLVELGFEKDGEELRVAIAAGDNCGFASVRDSSAHVFVDVQPKIDGVQAFTLMAMAGDPRSHFINPGADLAVASDTSLVELLVESYLIALRRLMKASGLRGLHEQQQHLLRGRMKGRVLVPAYLREVASGRPHHVPCAYSSHTVDNFVNRALRAALHALLRASPLSTQATVDLDKLDASFAGVTLSPDTNRSVSRELRLPESFRPYFESGALPLARFILVNLRLSATPGDIRAVAVAFPMFDIFERAFAWEVARRTNIPLNTVAQLEWPIRAVDGSGAHKAGTFIPDVVLPPSGPLAGLIADTKWKTVIDKGVQARRGEAAAPVNIRGIQLHNADIFQMLAYLKVARSLHPGETFVAALIYPVVDVSAASLGPIQVQIELPAGTTSLPLFLVPWDVGRECAARTNLLWDQLQRLRGQISSGS